MKWQSIANGKAGASGPERAATQPSSSSGAAPAWPWDLARRPQGAPGVVRRRRRSGAHAAPPRPACRVRGPGPCTARGWGWCVGGEGTFVDKRSPIAPAFCSISVQQLGTRSRVCCCRTLDQTATGSAGRTHLCLWELLCQVAGAHARERGPATAVGVLGLAPVRVTRSCCARRSGPHSGSPQLKNGMQGVQARPSPQQCQSRRLLVPPAAAWVCRPRSPVRRRRRSR